MHRVKWLTLVIWRGQGTCDSDVPAVINIEQPLTTVATRPDKHTHTHTHNHLHGSVLSSLSRKVKSSTEENTRAQTHSKQSQMQQWENSDNVNGLFSEGRHLKSCCMSHSCCFDLTATAARPNTTAGAFADLHFLFAVRLIAVQTSSSAPPTHPPPHPPFHSRDALPPLLCSSQPSRLDRKALITDK